MHLQAVSRLPLNHYTNHRICYDVLVASSIDMNGNIAGGILQSLRTIPGHYYQISFALTGSWFESIQRMIVAPLTVEVKFGIQDAGSFTAFYQQGWQLHSVTLAAQSAVTNLTFKSTAATAFPNEGW
jgi:hypothetical protein